MTCWMHSFTQQESVFRTSSGASGLSYSASIPVNPDQKRKPIESEEFNIITYKHNNIVLYQINYYVECFLKLVDAYSATEVIWCHTKSKLYFTSYLSCSGFLVQPLYIPLLTDIKWSIHKHLKEGQPSSFMDLPGIQAILLERMS